jgi:hypothetical protein
MRYKKDSYDETISNIYIYVNKLEQHDYKDISFFIWPIRKALMITTNID